MHSVTSHCTEAGNSSLT
uniref:Uncharacterized protein n=1 Tax=Anguilla anguilla TaxID=7936 RepID=A0A0E9QFB6_ANGAN